ncbi:hypothetical protein RintRC_4107 [Richelia intracellularis]|nr:hypothetical protein RintRC_4107 [Richelia intracellularis]
MWRSIALMKMINSQNFATSGPSRFINSLHLSSDSNQDFP